MRREVREFALVCDAIAVIGCNGSRAGVMISTIEHKRTGTVWFAKVQLGMGFVIWYYAGTLLLTNL